MKNISLPVILLLLTGLLSTCEKKDDPEIVNPSTNDIEAMIADAPVDPYQVAMELLEESGWPQEEELGIEPRAAGRLLSNYRREVIAGDIVHYSFELPMGSDPNDKIAIHRVVREPQSRRPVKANKVLFYQHGDAKNFAGMMLPGTLSPSTGDDFGMAVFLARNGVDVWGIDQAWTLTPKETADLSFMADWGLQKQITDLRQAMSVARIARFLTGNGLGKVILAGYSSGAITGFATLNEETQLLPPVRHVNGYISLDIPIKTNNAELIAFLKSYYGQLQAAYDAGEYAEQVPFQALGGLARTNPGGPSPILEGFTNLQAALFYGAGPIFQVIPFHYLAGEWENDLPIDLQYMTIDQWFDFLESAPAYEALLFEVEAFGMISDALDLPFDDHLAEITVPIYNVSPAGGFGELSKHGTTLLGSRDIEHLITSLRPPEEVLFDFAHIDLFIANNAETLVWQPVLEWINRH